MSWVVGRIDAVAPTAIERETRIRVGHAVTVALAGVLGAALLSGAVLVTGGVYRALANVGLVVAAASLLYVAWVSHVTYRRSEKAASTLVFAVGVVGLSITGLTAILLAIISLTPITPPTEPFVSLRTLGILVAGLWFVGLSALEYGIHVVSTGVASFGFVTGLGAVTTGLGLLFGGLTHPVFLLGLATFVVGFVPWAVVLRSHLLASYD